jgi:uncharacterized protein YegP (UPF0339 family)
MDCEAIIAAMQSNIEKYTYVKSKLSNGKYFFKMMLNDELISTSRKYSTPLLLQKGINEILQHASKSEVLDFSRNDFKFIDFD